ncbi:efflux RND transporter periplasmic adaptor subunit [Niabella insulamsoli]|uniref:efflux RND transporter periplasmic adaptor subunit n=1 Tax=Niabella insulamsoli TaxID=3144874 RepID=UPI0031FC918E
MKKLFPLLCIIIVATQSCKSHHEEKEARTSYVVTSPIKADTTFTKDYVCQIHAINHIEVRALEKGYLQHIYVDEGQYVKKGQLLFQIMPSLYQAEVSKAQAEVKAANIEYSNTKSLADKNIVAANELAMADANLDKAKAELALARTHLGFTNIRAPFSGIVDRFLVRVGSLLDEGELLTSLSDNSKMWVYFNVPESEYLNFRANKKADKAQVHLLMANNQLFPYQGVVETIEADFDNETGNIPFRATFPNPDRLLRHGETGNIRMTEPLTSGLIVPQKATFEVLDKKYIYVLDAKDRIRSKEITVGTEMEDLFVVTSGLNESDKILLEGIRKVKENEKISYEFKDPRAVIGALKLSTE